MRVRAAGRGCLLGIAVTGCHADVVQGASPAAAGFVSEGASPPDLVTRVLFETWIGPFGDGGTDLNGDGKSDIVASNRCLHTDFRPAYEGDEARANFVAALSPCGRTELRRWSGGPGFGYRVALGGDADGDGCGDLLETTGDVYGDDQGRIQVLSGRTGHTLLAISGRKLGNETSWIGDVDGDGLSDFACTAAPDAITDPCPPWPCVLQKGSFGIELRSGRDGALLAQRMAPSPSYDEGYLAVEAFGDLDLDGVPDVLAALPGNAIDCETRTIVAVLSGRTAAVILDLPDVSVGDEAHESIAHAGDIDADGIPDILVGNDAAEESGAASVISGGTRRLIHRWVGGSGGDGFGWSVAGIGDASGDGVPDIAVGAPKWHSAAAGYVSVFSGLDGRLLGDVDGLPDPLGFNGSKLGICVRPAGDVDGDGRTDVLAGAENSFNRHGPEADGLIVFGLAPR